MIEYYKENLEEHNANEEHLEYHTKESVVNLYKDLLRLTNELIKGSGTSEDVGKVYIVQDMSKSTGGNRMSKESRKLSEDGLSRANRVNGGIK